MIDVGNNVILVGGFNWITVINIKQKQILTKYFSPQLNVILSFCLLNNKDILIGTIQKDLFILPNNFGNLEIFKNQTTFGSVKAFSIIQNGNVLGANDKFLSAWKYHSE